MTITAISGGELYTPSSRMKDGTVLIEDGRIRAVADGNQVEISQQAEVCDAAGLIVAPGFIDLHTHGLFGHDVMGSDLADAIAAYPQFGVTSFLATTFSAPMDELLQNLNLMAAVLNDPPAGARCLGIHLEGPHLAASQAGAHNPDTFHPLDWEEFQRLQAAAGGRIRMITLAPELEGHLELIPRLIEAGVVPSLGHSNATFEQAQAAIGQGLRHASHTFNAMRGLHQREPGAVGAVLHSAELYAQVIADGIHVHPAVLQLLLRTKGHERVLLVSDSSPYAAQPAGKYKWSGTSVTIRNDRIETNDGRLAGANALLDQGLRTLVHQCDLPLSEALECATSTPAAAMGWHKKGHLAPEVGADIVLLDAGLSPVMTIVAGERVWSRHGQNE